MIKTKNLEDLLDKNKARKLFLQYQKKCGLSDDFEIQNIHRHLVLSPKTYALLYQILDGSKIKKIRVNASSEETRLRGFEVMRFLMHEFNGPKFFVPKVFFYDIDYNLICYENIEGQLLINHLKENSLDKKIILVAKWLNHLHSLETPDLILPKHEIFFNFEALKKFYPELAKNAPSIINDLKNQVSSDFEPKLIHGDYQPNNIIFDDDKITVFDFNDSQIADSALDSAKFLTQLKVMLFRFADVRRYENLKKLFLDSYKSEFNQNNFKIYSQMYFMQILSSLSASLAEDVEAQKTLPEVYKYWEEENGT